MKWPNVNSGKTSRMLTRTSQRREVSGWPACKQELDLCLRLPSSAEMGDLLCALFLSGSNSILLACKRWLVQSTGAPPRREGERKRNPWEKLTPEQEVPCAVAFVGAFQGPHRCLKFCLLCYDKRCEDRVPSGWSVFPQGSVYRGIIKNNANFPEALGLFSTLWSPYNTVGEGLDEDR